MNLSKIVFFIFLGSLMSVEAQAAPKFSCQLSRASAACTSSRYSLIINGASTRKQARRLCKQRANDRGEFFCKITRVESYSFVCQVGADFNCDSGRLTFPTGRFDAVAAARMCANTSWITSGRKEICKVIRHVD